MSNALLGRLCIVFGQPDSHDPAAYLAEVAKMIAKYPPNILEKAGDLILRTHRGKGFPKPNDIVTACEDSLPDPANVIERVRRAEFEAACFVCAMEHNAKTGKREPIGFAFSQRFRSHPWVEQSEREGWANELRGHLRQVVKGCVLAEKPYGDINELMPDKSWVEAARTQAKRYAEAKAWRDKVTTEHGSVEAFLLKFKPKSMFEGRR